MWSHLYRVAWSPPPPPPRWRGGRLLCARNFLKVDRTLRRREETTLQFNKWRSSQVVHRLANMAPTLFALHFVYHSVGDRNRAMQRTPCGRGGCFKWFWDDFTCPWPYDASWPLTQPYILRLRWSGLFGDSSSTSITPPSFQYHRALRRRLGSYVRAFIRCACVRASGRQGRSILSIGVIVTSRCITQLNAPFPFFFLLIWRLPPAAISDDMYRKPFIKSPLIKLIWL